jgi:DNA modification methylase
MARVEHIGDATLHLGDCLDIMPTLGKFDAVVTDPPYGIGESSKKAASRALLAAVKDYGEFNWDSKPASDAAIDALREASQHQIIFGGNYFTLPPTSCWLVWDKKNGKTDFADCELAWTNLAKAVRRIEWLWHGMIRKGDDVRQHPTQKPVGVIKWCIGHLPASTETILDPFMGSGTTGVACAKMGRKFTGIELDEGYFDIACRRIEEAYAQPDLFVEPPKPSKQEALEL